MLVIHLQFGGISWLRISSPRKIRTKREETLTTTRHFYVLITWKERRMAVISHERPISISHFGWTNGRFISLWSYASRGWYGRVTGSTRLSSWISLLTVKLASSPVGKAILQSSPFLGLGDRLDSHQVWISKDSFKKSNKALPCITTR